MNRLPRFWENILEQFADGCFCQVVAIGMLYLKLKPNGKG